VVETRRKPGELGPYVGYRSKLLSLGYAPETAKGQLKVLGQLGRWMAVNGLAPSELNADNRRRRSSRARAADYLRFGADLAFLGDFNSRAFAAYDGTPTIVPDYRHPFPLLGTLSQKCTWPARLQSLLCPIRDRMNGLVGAAGSVEPSIKGFRWGFEVLPVGPSTRRPASTT
jgi:hypothetical protein